MGFPRLGLPQQAELLPLLLEGLNEKPVQHLDSLLFIALPGLSCVDLTTELLKQPYSFLKEKTELSKYIREFLLDIILLPYGSVSFFWNQLVQDNSPMFGLLLKTGPSGCECSSRSPTRKPTASHEPGGMEASRR